MTDSGIVTRGVRRSFGRTKAVRDVSFEARPGAVTGLIGPNGAGKTTLLLMIASLLAPDDGDVRVAGIDPLKNPRDVRRVLGWMPDSLGAPAALSCFETLVASARLYDMSRQDARRRADELIALVGLERLRDSPARVMSRGQKQKLGLARALVHDPQVLLLDEPASGLDPNARVLLREMLRDFAAQGRTVLLSSHVLSELEEIVDEAVFMKAGTTIEQSSWHDTAAMRREWRIRLLERDVPAATIDAALGLPSGTSRIERGDILVAFSGDSDAASGLRRLVAAGLNISVFSPAVGALESAFLDLEQAGVRRSRRREEPTITPAAEKPISPEAAEAQTKKAENAE